MRVRNATLYALFTAYIVVSLIAWSDYPRTNDAPPLDAVERAGLEVWRQNNCQSCHQLYGFGGFHGPDLTNYVTDDKPDNMFKQLLVSGYGLMPAFNLSDDDQHAVLRYLRAMNRTGRGTPRAIQNTIEINSVTHLETLTARWTAATGETLPETASAGLDVWTIHSCGSCHIAFTIGHRRAPDLFLKALDTGVPSLTTTLTVGLRTMPTFAVTSNDIANLSAYLKWATEHRAELTPLNDELLGREPFSLSSLPWFEF